MREYCIDDIRVGLTESFSREITPRMEQAFREITGDVNPLHRDDAFAVEISGGKYPSHVAFGMLTASLYSTLAGVYLPGKYSLIHSMEEIKFLRPVFAGDVLTVTGEVADMEKELRLLRVNAVIKNQKGQTVSKARIKVMVMK